MIIMKKRICVVSSNYPSKGRPVYVFVEQLVNTLVDMGEDISVVAPQSITRSLFRHISILPYKQEYKTSNGNKYTVYRPYSISFGKFRRWGGFISDFISRYFLNKCISEIAPDILYVHFWINALGVLNFASKEHKPIFVACGEGDDAMEEMMDTISFETKEMLKEKVKGVICVSSQNRNKCINYDLADKEDIVVIPNAVDVSIFHPNERNNRLRKQLNVNDDDFLILFVGSFTERKGCVRLAKAVDQLKDSQIKIIFIGKPFPGYELQFSCNGIVYRGEMEHNNLPDYYLCADVFVLPTLNEGCSNAIVEALACGVPVISSKRPFNEDILNEQNAILVNPESVDEIANAISLLKRDKELLKEKKNYIIQHVKQYSLIDRAKRIRDFIYANVKE